MRKFTLSLVLGVAALAGTLLTPSRSDAQFIQLQSQPYYSPYYSYPAYTYAPPAYSYYYDPGLATYSVPYTSYYYSPGLSTYVAPSTTYYYPPRYRGYYSPFRSYGSYYRRW